MPLHREVAFSQEALQLVRARSRPLLLQHVRDVVARVGAEQGEQARQMLRLDGLEPFVLAVVAHDGRRWPQILPVDVQVPAVVEAGAEMAAVLAVLLVAQRDRAWFSVCGGHAVCVMPARRSMSVTTTSSSSTIGPPPASRKARTSSR